MSLESPPQIKRFDGNVLTSELQIYLNRIYGEFVNFVGSVVTVSTGVLANTEFVVPHLLQKIPTYVHVLTVQGQTDAYLLVKPSGTAWTTTNAYLKCNTDNATVTLRII